MLHNTVHCASLDVNLLPPATTTPMGCYILGCKDDSTLMLEHETFYSFNAVVGDIFGFCAAICKCSKASSCRAAGSPLSARLTRSADIRPTIQLSFLIDSFDIKVLKLLKTCHSPANSPKNYFLSRGPPYLAAHEGDFLT